MIVICPSCSTGFRVSAAALGAGGRAVQCSRCRYGWHQKPEAGGVVRGTPVPKPVGPPRPEPSYSPPAARGGRAAAAVLAVVVLLLVPLGLRYGCDRVIAAWPEAARYYRAVDRAVAQHVPGSGEWYPGACRTASGAAGPPCQGAAGSCG